MPKLRWMVCSLALFGCGASGVTTAPPKPATRADVGLSQLRIRPDALRPGEHFGARAEVMGMKVGKLDVSVRAPCSGPAQPAAGQSAAAQSAAAERIAAAPEEWLIQADLSTSGVLRWFSKTDGSSETAIDPKNFRAKRNHTHVKDGDEWRDYVVRYKSGKFSYTFTKSNGQKKRETKLVPDEEVLHDTQTAVGLLRSWRPAKVGEASYFYVVIGRHLWRADVTYKGPKALEAGQRSERALLFDGVAHRVDLKPGEEYTPRAFAVWLRDDASRVPLRVSGDGSVGAITFYLERHDFGAECIPNEKSAAVAAPAAEAAAPTVATAPAAVVATPATELAAPLPDGTAENNEAQPE